MSGYFDELCAAMKMLGELPNTVFIGQGVAVPGTTMTPTFKDVPKEKLVEMPIAEEMYTGMCIGMSLQGYLPVCIIPRWNFMLRAADQIINHLDRLPIYGNGFKPKVIIRTAVPSTTPFNPGPQHDDDLSVPFRIMMRSILVLQCRTSDGVRISYDKAVKAEQSSIVSEYTHLYRDERARPERRATSHV